MLDTEDAKSQFKTEMKHGRKHHALVLLRALNSYRMNDKFCDYTLVAGGLQVRVHKTLLVTFSHYFECLFNTDMREASGQILHLAAIDGAQLKVFVKYIYTGMVNITEKNVHMVVKVGSYLQVEGLLSLCETFFINVMGNIDNYRTLLEYSEMYGLYTTFDGGISLMARNITSLYKHCTSLTAYQLLRLLEHHELRVKSELSLVYIVQCWMRAKLNVKLKEFPVVSNVDEEPWRTFVLLVYKIRWRLLTSQELESRRNNPVISAMHQIPKCRELLDDARHYHENIYEQPMLQYDDVPETWVRSKGYTSIVTSFMDEFKAVTLGGFTRDREFKGIPDVFHLIQHKIANVNDFLFVCGGWLSHAWSTPRVALPVDMYVTARCFRYDPRFNTWLELTPMSVPRTSFVLVSTDTKLCVFGGKSALTADSVIKSCECYDIATNTWTLLPDLPSSSGIRDHAGCFVYDDTESRIYVSGGHDKNIVVSTMYKYNIEKQEWSECPEMNHARHFHTMAFVWSSLYVIGGTDRRDQQFGVFPIERFSLETEQWTDCFHKTDIPGETSTEFLFGVFGASHYVTSDDDIVILGGTDEKYQGRRHTLKTNPDEPDCIEYDEMDCLRTQYDDDDPKLLRIHVGAQSHLTFPHYLRNGVNGLNGDTDT